MAHRLTGTVKWYNRRGGFGFIMPDGADHSLFVDLDSILGDGSRALTEGERVEFSTRFTSRGPRADRVVRLGAVMASD